VAVFEYEIFADLCHFFAAGLHQRNGPKRLLQIPALARRLARLLTRLWCSPDVWGRTLLSHTIAGEEETVPTGTCPECDADVHVDLDTDKGEIVNCEECGTELEVVGLDPVELDIVEEESYDEDEDEDEY